MNITWKFEDKQRGFGFFDCQPGTPSYCEVTFDYPKECISLPKLPREILEELFEEDASHRVCDEYLEEGKCNIFLPERNGFWCSFPVRQSCLSI